MCSPDLQLKIQQAAKIFAAEEEKPRDRLKVMNYITGQTAFNDARYAAIATSP